LNNQILDFESKNCKQNDHNSCASKWHGLGFDIICNCRCHKKEMALHLDDRPLGNASTIKGAVCHDDE
jgi:hypothetical protein